MINAKNLFVVTALVAVVVLSCNSGQTKNEDQPPTAAGVSVLKEEPVSIRVDSVTMKCYLTYDDSIKTRRPAVLVIPEWWGLVEYPRMRAKELFWRRRAVEYGAIGG